MMPLLVLQLGLGTEMVSEVSFNVTVSYLKRNLIDSALHTQRF